MRVKWIALIGMLLIALPVMAGADIIPISDVNENGEPETPGDPAPPLLEGTVVTVQGVAVVGTGMLAGTNDLYVQDATGGVNVVQVGMASPVVARGDSLRVTGQVYHATSNGRTGLKVGTSEPGTRIVVINRGNPVPAPLELTPREISVSGEELEGIYAVVKGVSLDGGWANCGSPPEDSFTIIADADTACWLWFDVNTDLCGSDEPLETFDVYGLIVPDIKASLREGHGILVVSRADVHSAGPGSGFVTVEPGRLYTEEISDLTFEFEADGGILTTVTIAIPAGWDFSGNLAHIELSGPAFDGVTTISTPDDVFINGCNLTAGSPGTVTLEGITAPDYAGDFTFEVLTADAGNDLAAIVYHPEVGVGAQAAPRAVLINELYAYSGGTDLLDRSEFVELYNPGAAPVDLTGWVLTDVGNTGDCTGSDLWEFPEGASIDAGQYLVIAKDARFQFGSGFFYVFGEYPDYELVDPYHQDLDWPDEVTPNLILLDADDGNSGVSQEIRLIGGADGDGTLVAGNPSYEAVFLYSDRAKEFLVDAVEYRDPVFLSADACYGIPDLGGPDDAWTPGPPPRHISLGRNPASDDTDVSSDDFSLLDPSPGEQNPAGDETDPVVSEASGVSHNLALIEFSEPLDETSAENRSNYLVGGGVTVLDAQLSRDGRTVLLTTTDRAPGSVHSVDVMGVTDLSANAMVDFSDSLRLNSEVMSITEVQEYDENGLSVKAGQEGVKAVGFTTVPPGVFQPNYTSMYMQEPGGAGVNVFMYDQMPKPPLEGDLIMARGEIVDYIGSTGAGATTEISATAIPILARGFEPLEPMVLETGEVGNEDNEGLLVKSSGTVVSVEGFAIYINDGSGSVQIYQNFNDLDFAQFAVGDSVCMTGVVLQYDQTSPYFSGYELSPRYDFDMEILEAHYSEGADARVEARVLDIGANEAIEIRYNAPSASHVTVRIFDLKGREVTTLYDGFCLGPQRAVWDARDNEGKKVPMGAYICHVLARDQGRGEGSETSVPIVVGKKLD